MIEGVLVEACMSAAVQKEVEELGQVMELGTLWKPRDLYYQAWAIRFG